MKRTIIFCCIAVLVLFCTAYMFGGQILDFLFNLVCKDNIQIQGNTVSGPVLWVIWLSSCIAVIPLFLLATWLLGNITLFKHRMFSIIIVLLFITICIAIDVWQIRSNVPPDFNGIKTKILIPFEVLHFEYAVLIGIFLGSFLSYFIFKRKKQSLPAK